MRRRSVRRREEHSPTVCFALSPTIQGMTGLSWDISNRLLVCVPLVDSVFNWHEVGIGGMALQCQQVLTLQAELWYLVQDRFV